MDKEELENHVYKDVIEAALKNGESSDFCPFRKEKQMDYLFSFLEKDFKKKHQKILDACCGYGRLIYFLNEFDPSQFYIGIDYVKELVEKGKSTFSQQKNISFECGDVMSLSDKFHKKFDISINYKTLSWLPYYSKIISQLVKATKKKIYITSLFYDGDIDFIMKINQNASYARDDNFLFLNTYSFPKFEKYCKSLGVKDVNAIDMRLDFDLPKSEDLNKLQTYTLLTDKQERLEITSIVLLNWKLVELVL